MKDGFASHVLMLEIRCNFNPGSEVVDTSNCGTGPCTHSTGTAVVCLLTILNYIREKGF